MTDHGGDAAGAPGQGPEDGAERTEFALDEWSEQDRALLDRLLIAEGIAHAWQGASVVVATGSQFVVDDLIDAVEEGTAVEAGLLDGAGPADAGDSEGAWDDDAWDDDVDAQEVLGAVFIAADRLQRRGSDPEGVLALVDQAAVMVSMRLPFGFDPAIWDDLVTVATALASALTADEGSPGDVGDERIEEMAADLRARLRPLV